MGRLMRSGEGPPIVPVSGWSAPLTSLAAGATALLAVLALAAALAAGRLAESWRTDLSDLATVQVTAPRERLPEALAGTLAVLETTPGIRSTRVLSEAEHEALLSPWLGEAANLTVLPAPRLIEIAFDGAGPDAEALRARLAQSAPGATYDDHDAWRVPMARAADRLELLGWFAAGLITLAAAGVVALAARATLAANLEVVRTVRLIGGDDRFIAGAFVRRLAVRALLGGALGAALGGLALISFPAAPTGGLMHVSLLPGPIGWALLLLGVPVAGGLIALITAKIAVRLALRRLM